MTWAEVKHRLLYSCKCFLHKRKGITTSKASLKNAPMYELNCWLRKLPSLPKEKKGKSSKRNGEKKQSWVAEKTEKELEKLQVFWLEWNSKCFQSRSFTTGSNTRLNMLTNRRKWNWNESIEVLDVSFYQRRCWTSQNSSKMRDQTAIIKTEWKSWRLQKPKRNSTWKAES